MIPSYLDGLKGNVHPGETIPSPASKEVLPTSRLHRSESKVKVSQVVWVEVQSNCIVSVGRLLSEQHGESTCTDQVDSVRAF